MQPNDFDATDRAILDILQREGRLSNVELAERVRLSPSACLRRTKSLEDRGVIAGYRAVVEPGAVGLGLTVFVSLRVDQHGRQVATEITNALLAIPEVVACHMVSGDADFLVELLVPDLAGYERVLIDRIVGIEQVKDARSVFSLRTFLRDGPVAVGG